MRPIERSILVATAVACLPGCASVESVRSLPRSDYHAEAHYSAAGPSIQGRLPAILDSLGSDIEEEAQSEQGETTILALRPPTRIVLTPGGDGMTRVRVVSHPVGGLNSSSRASLRVVTSLDAALGPRNVVIANGSRVRALTTGPGSRVEGEVVEGGDGEWWLQDDDGARLPVGRLREVEVLRGSYHHARTFSWIGAAVGLVAAIVSISGGDESCGFGCWEQDFLELMLKPPLFIGLGSLVGSATGAAMRTQVWSPAAGVAATPRAAAPRPGHPGRRRSRGYLAFRTSLH